MIEIETNISHLPPEKLWNILTEDQHIQKWWGKGVSLETKEYGKFYQPWQDNNGKQHITIGIVTAIDPKKRLQIDWMNPGWPKPTRVDIMLTPVASGTKVFIQHSGWNIFDTETRNREFDAHRMSWHNLLDKLKTYADNFG